MNFQSKKTMPRYFLVTAVLVLAGVCAMAKAVYTMTVDRDKWMGMSKLLVKEGRPLPAKRGNILAADGQILAASLPEYRVYLDFKSVERNPKMREKDQYRRDSIFNRYIDTICLCMHEIFPDIIPSKLKAHLTTGKDKLSRYWPVYVDSVSTLKLKRNENRQITYIEYSKVEKLPLFNLKSSANYVKIDMRKRPFGDLARRTIGDFKDGARHGLEKSFDTILAGKPGKFHFHKVMNRRVRVVDQPAEDGNDVLTTIDVGMQDICEKALRDKLREINAVSGICILMEVPTGDIKAMTSLSRYADGSYREDRPMAVTDLYEPGSVFKPQAFLVAFNDGKISMNDQVDVGRGIHEFGSSKMKDHNWRTGGYGVLTVPAIIGNSSNVGVSVLIDQHYSGNEDAFVDGLYRIGSAEDLEIPLPGYQKPRIRHRSDNEDRWYRTTLPWMSIGYETQIAPINTLNFYNGIANNGKMVRPRLVKAIKRGNQIVQEFPVKVLREQMAKPEAVQNVRSCLEYVTTLGVGKAAASKLFPVAGKTGTAQIWTGGGRTSEYFVTFAGYFPADKPQYSCIVCIRKPAPASGGGQCGPVFKRVAETIMARQHVNDYSSARDTLHASRPVAYSGDMASTARLFHLLGITTNTTLGDNATTVWGRAEHQAENVTMTMNNDSVSAVPDVLGYGLRDAVCRLESMGLKVRVEGVGKVKAQSLPAGHALKKGEVITLTLGYDKVKPHLKKPVVAAVQQQPVAVQPENVPLEPAANTSGHSRKPVAPEKNRQR